MAAWAGGEGGLRCGGICLLSGSYSHRTLPSNWEGWVYVERVYSNQKT